MTIRELKIKRFLRVDLGMKTKYAGYDTLKEMLIRLSDDIESKQNIIAGETKDVRILNLNHRRLSYYIETHFMNEDFRKVLGNNGKITPKEFVITCFEYFDEKYN